MGKAKVPPLGSSHATPTWRGTGLTLFQHRDHGPKAARPALPLFLGERAGSNLTVLSGVNNTTTMKDRDGPIVVVTSITSSHPPGSSPPRQSTGRIVAKTRGIDPSSRAGVPYNLGRRYQLNPNNWQNILEIVGVSTRRDGGGARSLVRTAAAEGEQEIQIS